MDPITQGAVGAVAAQLGSKRTTYLYAAIIGALAGMAPDLDVLIRSSSDPLLFLKYHRQVTHSLFAIPILGGLCGLLAWWLLGKRWQISLKQAVLWSMLGYATHGLLDGCTSYGTQLLWPLSSQRFSWDLVSVVDPLFTLPILVAIGLAVRKKATRWVAVAAVWGLVYLGIGVIQHERAIEMGQDLAAQRNHTPLRLEAKPSFGNLVVWKVIYETKDRFYVDAVKPGWRKGRVWPGESLVKFTIPHAYTWLAAHAQQRRDIDRFASFSAGYIAVDPENPMRVFDVRYAMLPQRMDPMWGIELSAEKSAAEHITWFTQRNDSRAALTTLITMIFE